MGMGFLKIPRSRRYRLSGATVPVCLSPGLSGGDEDGLARVDIIVADGRIESIEPPAQDQGIAKVDLGGAMVFPCFIEAHTHIDKGHIWPRARNPDGTFSGALNTVMEDRATNWSERDLRARMRFSLKSAHAYGTVALRTHIDSPTPQMATSWRVFAEIRAEWAGRIELQGSSLVGVDAAAEPGYLEAALETVTAYGGILGCVTYMSPNLLGVLEAFFRAALDKGLKLDFHVDETMDPGARSLGAIAETAIRYRWRERGRGPILVGHCCSLSTQDKATVDRTLDLIAEAGLAVVSLPMCNMYLQDRSVGATPRRRGVTLLHEMKARGTPVMVASDNTRDPFYAYGDLDMLEVYREATRILHLDHPVGDWPRAVTATPAEVCGFEGRGLVALGAPADLVIVRGRTWTETLSRPQSDRVVLRAGLPVDTNPPDYSDLDPIFVPTSGASL